MECNHGENFIERNLPRLGISALDVINYLAITSLEELGNLKPTESEIYSMERCLLVSIQNYLNQFNST